jgi:AcrR family transcriptional regulator
MAKALMGRKGRPTADDSREKMALVLDAAREEFARLGYRAVTMRAVADKAQVSTRTLYNRYADKLSLFTACLDQSGDYFPRPDAKAGETPLVVLRRYATALVHSLSSDTSLRLSMMVYREGSEFPELLTAAEDNQIRYLIRPLALYLQTLQVESRESEAKARLFIAMALSEWQQRVTFRHPLQQAEELASHAAVVAEIFVHGCGLPGQSTPDETHLWDMAG